MQVKYIWQKWETKLMRLVKDEAKKLIEMLPDTVIAVEKTILDRFKALLAKRVNVYKLVLFGSRARGDAEPSSDMDVLVILDGIPTDKDIDYVSDCAWEAGFEYGIVVVPVVYTRSEWETSPERYSLLALAVEKEGVPL
jgi:predicted nucleotidyltransferase